MRRLRVRRPTRTESCVLAVVLAISGRLLDWLLLALLVACMAFGLWAALSGRYQPPADLF